MFRTKDVEKTLLLKNSFKIPKFFTTFLKTTVGSSFEGSRREEGSNVVRVDLFYSVIDSFFFSFICRPFIFSIQFWLSNVKVTQRTDKRKNEEVEDRIWVPTRTRTTGLNVLSCPLCVWFLRLSLRAYDESPDFLGPFGFSCPIYGKRRKKWKQKEATGIELQTWSVSWYDPFLRGSSGSYSSIWFVLFRPFPLGVKMYYCLYVESDWRFERIHVIKVSSCRFRNSWLDILWGFRVWTNHESVPVSLSSRLWLLTWLWP